jgi:phosphoribosyl 1,2-cyclic phosphodiesterase
VRVTSLGSGSNGNAFVIQAGNTTVLLDAGIPIRTLRAGIRALGLDECALSAVVVSHEHSDHVRALPQICRAHTGRCLATAGTSRQLRALSIEADWETLRAGERFDLGGLALTPLSVSHDAAEPVGFLFENGAACVAVVTDLGQSNGDVEAAISRAQLVVLESNYDDAMLSRGSYPAHLKRRIRGPRGHLSNGECASVLGRHLTSSITEIWLAHLSENNNRPTLAYETVINEVGSGPGHPAVRPLPRYGRTVTWDYEVIHTTPRQVSLF